MNERGRKCAFSGARADGREEGQDGDGGGQREQGRRQHINVEFKYIHVHA